MDRFRRLIVQAHRRSLWQVLSIYLVTSWVGYEVISELTQGLGLPEWVPGFAVVLFLIGLPIVLATAFIQEGGPARREQPTHSYAPRDPTLLPLDLEPARPDVPAHHALFTWKKAIVGGVVAFLLLGITAGGYMGVRNAGIGPFGSLLAKGALDNRERVLIAEFNDLTGDSILAQAVTQAFRVSFAQSNVVTVVEPAYVRSVLGRMQRPATLGLDAELAREVAMRDNIKAYVTGEIARVGGRYSVIGKLLSSDDATVLATYAQEAADSTEILAAVDKLSRKLREKIGESLRTIRNDRPLAAVTTASLEALRKYTQAEHALEVEADVNRGIALLQEAVALDTAFAMAWRKLGIAYGNTDAPYAKLLEAQTRAYQHRDRLTDLERYLTAGSYHMSITEDLGQAEQAYRNALEVQPDNYVALNNIGIVYVGKRDYQRAREVTEKTLALGPNQFIPYGNLIEVLISLGQVDSAAVVAETMSGAIGRVAPYYFFLGEITAAKRDYAALEESARETIRIGGEQNVRVTRMHYAAAMAIQGRLADAERVLAELEQFERAQGEAHAGLRHALAAADVDVLIRQDPERAVRRLDAALAREPLDDVAVENRPYIHLAGLFAASGHPERARPLVAEQAKLPREIRGDDRDDVSHVEGWIALAEKRYADAISHFRLATTLGACARCEHVELGMAFEGVAQPDSAIAHYEYWVDTPYGDSQIEQDAPRLATVYERLAELYESKGDRQTAALYAGRLVELWMNADAELQPRVASARATLQRVGGDRPR
jgi:tetratricopeptide (TPR) repeat protein